MIVGLYTSVIGKKGMSESLEVISRNLANVNTTGFKKNMISFSSFMDEEDSVSGSEGKVFINHDQGSIKPTGNNLDLAIHGSGYFVLESGQGLKYSRNGHFLLNGKMEIVNDAGWRLMGDGGRLTLPKNAKDIRVNDDGSVIVDGVNAGTIQVVDFKDKKVLKEAGNSSFTASAGQTGEETSNFEIQQGFLESSNVSVIDEMVNLIANTKGFEGNNNVNKSIDRTLEKLIQTADSAI